jgi:hypothetical protein
LKRIRARGAWSNNTFRKQLKMEIIWASLLAQYLKAQFSGGH